MIYCRVFTVMLPGLCSDAVKARQQYCEAFAVISHIQDEGFEPIFEYSFVAMLGVCQQYKDLSSAV